MELYQLIATINNTSDSFTFDYLPENFNGLKINQKFSFVNPVGYVPKFSVETMRIILADKLAIDEVFLTYGLQSDVQIEIKELNSNGIGYSHLAYFAVDFESYDIKDEFSEFALKSMSSYDTYVNKKNTEKSYLLGAAEVALPNTLKYINYVSLKSISNYETDRTYFEFDKNNDSKIYDLDASLYHPTSPDIKPIVYYVGENTVTNLFLNISGLIKLKFSGSNKTGVSVKLYKAHVGSSLVDIHTFFTSNIISAGTEISIDIPKTSIDCGICSIEDFFIIATNIITDATVTGDFFIDIKKKTSLKILSSDNNLINYRSTAEILNDIFNFEYTTTNLSYLDRGITSANHLAKNSNILKIKPGEFISDLAKILGLVVNAKIDGTTQIEKFSDYFDNLLDTANAIEIVNYKDLSINHNSDLVFNSVQFGKETSDYDIYGYSLNWNKILTFIQTGRFGVDDLDLSLSKFRTDFSGILDAYVKRSELSDKDYKDNFIFDYNFTPITADNEDELIYDAFTPRDMLVNWSRFLSFCFQNFGLDTLTISSNGGSTDDLEISGVSQMDDLVLAETPRLLPIEYNFTCLIDNVDFSDHILKINHNEEDIYLFVIDAETTDKLSEQKIKGLKIQF